MSRVVVVGLGPAGGDLVLPAARDALVSAPARFARTSRHPAVVDLARDGVECTSFDDVYDSAEGIDAVYPAIVERLLVAAREHGEIAYAVPGNPSVAERSVSLLHDAAARGEVSLTVVPGLSFADLAWARIGVDPMAVGARVLDAHQFTLAAVSTHADGPMLLAQCDSVLVLADVKVALLDDLAPDTPVTVLHHLGLADERVETVPLWEIDRLTPDHLTALYIGATRAMVGAEMQRLWDLALRLRGPGGCAWDAEQSHHSLTRYILEEAYEVVEAVEALPPDAPEGEVAPEAYAALEDELGDLLYQVYFHAALAQEAGAFDLADVARGIHEKLVRRHPHVFADADAETSAAVMANWEQIKKAEKGTTSLVSGISPGLPSLLYAHKLYRKAAAIGLEPGSADEATARAEAALERLQRAADGDERALGDLLAATVVLARARGVDAESSLRGWVVRFRDRFEQMEHLAVARGVDLSSAPPDAVAALWVEAGSSGS